MTRSLAVVAGAGIAISVVCLSLAAALAGDDFGDFDFPGIHIDGLFGHCEASTATFAGNTREIRWDGDDDVVLNVPATTTYRPGAGDTLVATGPADALAHLRVRDGRIEFDCRGLDLDEELHLTLPGRRLDDFTVNGSGTLALENLDLDQLDIAVRGSGRVRASGTSDDVDLEIAGSGAAELADFAAQRMDIKIAGSGAVRATGTTNDLDLAIAGSGDADLGGLVAGRADIAIAGSGDASVAAEDDADITIAGSGNVRFVTQPRHVDTRIFGSGRIIDAPTPAAPATEGQPTPTP
jgi:hypothetical protein